METQYVALTPYENFLYALKAAESRRLSTQTRQIFDVYEIKKALEKRDSRNSLLEPS